jgi:hypothetical protein
MATCACRGPKQAVLIDIKFLCEIVVFSVLLKLLLIFHKNFPEPAEMFTLILIPHSGVVLNHADFFLQIQFFPLPRIHPLLYLLLPLFLDIVLPLLADPHQLHCVQNQVFLDVLVEGSVSREARSVVDLDYDRV